MSLGGRAGGTLTAVPRPREHASGPLPVIAPVIEDAARRPLPRWLKRYVAAAVLVDVITAGLAVAVAGAVRFGASMATVTVVVTVLLFPAAWASLVFFCHGYDSSELGTGNEEFRRLGRAGLALLAALPFLSYAGNLQLPRALVVFVVPGAVVASALGRYALRQRLHLLRQQGRCMRTVVAVGRERAVLDLVRQLRRDRYCGMHVVAACVPDPANAHLLRAENVAVVGDLEGAAATARALDAEAVAVTSASETAATYLRRLSWDLEGSGIELVVAPGLIEVAGPRMHVRPFIGLPLLHVEEPAFTGPRRLIKGLIDRAAAALLLLVLLPVLVAVAVAVAVDSDGPVIYRQQRIGESSRPFTMFKFRTMVVDADARRAELLQRNQNADGLLFKVADDPRVTRVGRTLRRFSLDELPQLFNVLAGNMSLVGPRPPLPAEAERYDDSVRRRLLVKPGLTGLWQVSGRSDLSWDDAVRLDLRYVENWSLALDFMILWKTFFAVVRARGAY
jgi:exopolysaccharide biosynthesis polyprenyl glycosylphosphotransferase